VSAARWRVAARLLLGAILAVRLATFLDYGVSWDEQLERRNGSLTVRWYASGFEPLRIPEGTDQHLYGSFFNVLVLLAARLSPLGYYETGHLLVTLTGFLATVLACHVAAGVAGPRAGFFAALALTLTPAFYGHSVVNPKDVPFAAAFMAGTALLLRAGERPDARRLAAAGVAIGLAGGIRIVGLSLLGVAAFVLRRHPGSWRRFGGTSALALVVAAAFWPYLVEDPLRHAPEVLQQVTSFAWERLVLFRGELIPAAELPRTYLPTWFLIALPEFFLVALVPMWRPGPTVVLLGTLAVVPVAAAVALHAVVYDGFRQFLFVLPPMACLVGIGIDQLFGLRSGWVRTAALAGVAGSMAWTTTNMIELHPYQYVFFNRLGGGGLIGAGTRYETDYWGLSYREAADWVRRSYAVPPGERRTVANVSNEFFTDEAFGGDPRFEPIQNPRHADVVLAITRWNGHRRWPGRVLHVVERQGVPLCYVIERSGRSRGAGRVEGQPSTR
jgi:hypothetical protein